MSTTIRWRRANEKEWQDAQAAKETAGRPKTSEIGRAFEMALAGDRVVISCTNQAEKRKVLGNLAARRSRAGAQLAIFASGLDVYVGPGEYKPKPKKPSKR